MAQFPSEFHYQITSLTPGESVEYKIVTVKLTWRHDEQPEPVAWAELERKLNEAAQDGWRLRRKLEYEVQPSGPTPGFKDAITIVAILTRKRQVITATAESVSVFPRRYTLVYMPDGDTAEDQQFESGHEPVLGKVWYDGGDGVYLVMHETVNRMMAPLGTFEFEHHIVYLLDVTAGCRYLDQVLGGEHGPDGVWRSVAPVCQSEPWSHWPKGDR